MPPLSPPESKTNRPAESPVVWFSELLIAIDKGEYRHAAEAQRRLARLGWNVSPRKPRQIAHAPRQKAPGREGGR
jgi:hypothetical protein